MHDQRRACINGLLNLAILLESNPDLPVPTASITIRAFPATGPDDEMRAEVDRVATLLGTEIDPNHLPYGHYSTSVTFGPVSYEFTAILAAARARHAAEDSYRDCIQIDNTQEQ
jgi:hypothetical protein